MILHDVTCPFWLGTTTGLGRTGMAVLRGTDVHTVKKIRHGAVVLGETRGTNTPLSIHGTNGIFTIIYLHESLIFMVNVGT